MKNQEIKMVDIEADKELCISDLNLSDRAKNALAKLNVKTFEELLEIDYSELKNPRILGKTTLENIVNFVHKKGYFLKNEYVDWEVKTTKARKKGADLFWGLDITVSTAKFLYKNNLFRLEDLKKYGSNVFELEGIRNFNKKDITLALEKKDINLIESYVINTLEKIKESGCYEFSDLNIYIKEIGNFYYLAKDVLFHFYGDSLTLGELINIDYNELKETIGEYVNYDNYILLEIVNFLHSYGLSIRGYDRTVFRAKLLSKEVNNIKLLDSESFVSQNDLEKMTNLIKKYNEIMIQRQALLEEEEKLDLEIKELFSNIKQGVSYVREKK